MSEILSVIGLHLYQPPRQAFHNELSHIDTDPTHIDWTERILNESYHPLSTGGTLDTASFDMYGTLRQRIHELSPEVYSRMMEQMRENGVGDSYLHPILPDLSDGDKRILIQAGRELFFEETGVFPQVFWPPESALDYQTLNILAEVGYQGFICAPDQIKRADGLSSDNKPTRVRVAGGRSLIALPFDRPVSEELAFNPKVNADAFVSQIIDPARQRINGFNSLIAWTDGETFGHHNKRSIRFLEYLLSDALKGHEFIPVSINLLLSLVNNPGEGFLNQRTAWSCPHGDLVRWHGECGCGDGHDTAWKSPFYDAMHRLNAEISAVVAKHMPDYEEYLYAELKPALMFPGGAEASLELSLLAAKASALAALTSCATYFDDPHVSGNINVLFAYQACLHLRDAGFQRESERIMESFKYRLRWMPAWTYQGHAGTVIGDLLATS